MWTITSSAQTFIFREQSSQGTSPSITILQPQSSSLSLGSKTTLEQVLIFGLEAHATTETLYNHVTFGSLYSKEKRADPRNVLPPPEWAFGQFFSLKGITNEIDFDARVNYIQSVGFPIEGFMMEEEQLMDFSSFTIHSNFTKDNWLLKKISAMKGSLITVSKTGFPL
jgi:hypothetical protein